MDNGHVSRASELSTTMLQGTVPGGRRPGRQQRRWENNIEDWTGRKFADTQRLAKNREGWKNIVRNVSGAPTTNNS